MQNHLCRPKVLIWLFFIFSQMWMSCVPTIDWQQESIPQIFQFDGHIWIRTPIGDWSDRSKSEV